MTDKKEVAVVLGGGSFGTAMATILAENGHELACGYAIRKPPP